MTIGQMLRFIGAIMIIVGFLGLIGAIFGIKAFTTSLIFIGIVFNIILFCVMLYDLL